MNWRRPAIGNRSNVKWQFWRQPGEPRRSIPNDNLLPRLRNGRDRVDACNASHYNKCNAWHYTFRVIRSFKHKGLRRFFSEGDSRGVDGRLAGRLRRLLDRLEACTKPEDMNLPGFGFHELKGSRKGTYAVDVSGNLRMTFRFDSGDAMDANLEDYH